MSRPNALTRIGVLPFDWFGGGVVLADVGHQLAMEVLGRGEDAAIDEVALDFAEPKLDLVEPGRVGRGEVKLDSRVCGQKLLDSLGLVGREVVQDDVDLLTPRLAGDHSAEESDELLAGVPRSGLADDRAGLGVQRRVQGERPFTDIFETMALRAAGRHRRAITGSCGSSSGRRARRTLRFVEDRGRL